VLVLVLVGRLVVRVHGQQRDLGIEWGDHALVPVRSGLPLMRFRWLMRWVPARGETRKATEFRLPRPPPPAASPSLS
jgi:hypothetical protein